MLFKGLIRLRAELTALGITQGVQWIDGSFCEDVETHRKRPPKDIDVVTLIRRPPSLHDAKTWATLVQANTKIFESAEAKKEFGCEAFYIDAGFPALSVAGQLTYWFGLFTHQRVSHLWKGIVEVPLTSNDGEALKAVEKLSFAP